MFYNCKSLISIPDISIWNINNVSNLSYMFCGCESLISIPDISKWNINNVINMKGLFCACKSLKSFPNISKWNIKNLKYDDNIFYGIDESIINKYSDYIQNFFHIFEMTYKINPNNSRIGIFGTDYFCYYKSLFINGKKKNFTKNYILEENDKKKIFFL